MKRFALAFASCLYALPVLAGFGLHGSLGTPVAISGIGADVSVPAVATISYTTAPASQGTVCYGLTTGYGTCLGPDPSPVTGHSAYITGLVGATVYHYRITATASGHTQGDSGDLTFTTATPPGIATIAPNSTWTGTALSGTGTLPPALDVTIQGQLSVCGSSSGTGSFVVLTLCTSTATIASGDQWTVGSQAGTISGATDVGGTVEANGTWAVVVLNSTDVMLCSQAKGDLTGCLNGPTWANAWTSGGTIGVNAPVVAWWDEVPGQLITADNTEFIGIGAAISNRGWIDQTKCYFEGNEVDQTIDNQTANPTYGTHGIVYQVNNKAAPRSGVAELVCDVYPTNGKVRRIATQFWFNYAGTTGYIDRTNAAHIKYASATATPDTNTSNDCAHANHAGTSADPYQTTQYAIYCAGVGGIVYAKGTFTDPISTRFTASGKVLANASQRVDVYPWPGFSYTLGTVTRGQWYTDAVAIDFHDATWDMTSIQAANAACAAGSCSTIQEPTYNAWTGFVLCQNCTQSDGVNGLGTTYGYYGGTHSTVTSGYYIATGPHYYGVTESTFQMGQTEGLNFRRNNSGTNSGDEGEFEGFISGGLAGAAIPQDLWNESVTGPIDGSGNYLLAYNRLTRLPAPETVITLTPGQNVNCTYPVVPVNAESNAANLPVIKSVTYTGGNTKIELDDCEAVANNGGNLTVIIPDSSIPGTQLIAYNASGGTCDQGGSAKNCWTPGTLTPYVRPIIEVPGVNWVASGAAQVGNHIFVTTYQHGDNFKFNVPIAPIGHLDYNLYFQNYRANSANQIFFNQSGGFKQTNTIKEDATLSDCPGAVAPGTCIVMSATSTTSPVAGTYAWICAFVSCASSGTPQANAHQYRAITKIVDATHFIIDHAFGPSLGSTATAWNVTDVAANVACIACRNGATNTGTAGVGGDKAQIQEGAFNWTIVQMSMDWSMMFFNQQIGATGGTQGGGMSAQYMAFYDSILGWGSSTSTLNGCLDNSISFGNPTGCPSAAFQSYIEGITLDNMTYLNPNTSYGTGIVTLNKVHLDDADYSSVSAGVTQTVRGTWGNAHLANGTPLYPWTTAGAAKTSASPVGALP